MNTLKVGVEGGTKNSNNSNGIRSGRETDKRLRMERDRMRGWKSNLSSLDDGANRKLWAPPNDLYNPHYRVSLGFVMINDIISSHFGFMS